MQSFLFPGLIGIASGAMLHPAVFPGGVFPWLVWCAMIPLVLALYVCRPAQVILMWGFYSFAGWCASVFWLENYLSFVFDMPLAIVCLLMLGIFTIGSIPYVLTAYVMVRWQLIYRSGGILFMSAFLAILVEYVPVPFPGDLSLSLYRTPIFTQIADIGGSFFVLFALIFVNGLLAKMIYSLYSEHTIDRKTLAVTTLTLLSIAAYGSFRLDQYHSQYDVSAPSQLASIGFVQPNIIGADLSPRFGNYFPEDEKTNDLNSSVRLLEQLAEEGGRIDLLVWPEIPDFVPYSVDSSLQRSIQEIIEVTNAPFLYTDIFPYKKQHKKLTGWNAIHKVDTDNTFSVIYKKVNLVPFSEYLPFESQFPFLKRWFSRVNQLQHGKEGVVTHINSKIRLVPFICYDGVFPGYVRKLIGEKGGNVMLSLDNDVNFGPTNASVIHLSAMLYRAIEHRIPLLRVSNSGPSMLIQSSGEILKSSETPMLQKDGRVVQFLPGDESSKTIYQSGGRWLNLTLLFLSLFLIKRDSRCDIDSL